MRHVFTVTKLLISLLPILPFRHHFSRRSAHVRPQLRYENIDSAWIEEILAAAVNRKMTDVVFFFGEEDFGVHPSLLSDRSPVFLPC